MTNHTHAKIHSKTNHDKTPESVRHDDGLNPVEKADALRSMALDADQLLTTTSEGMSGATKSNDANDLQSALVQLGKVDDPVAVYDPNSKKSRFQSVLVITTVNQTLNREVVEVACGIAEVAAGKLNLLSVIPPAATGGGITIGAIGTAVPIPEIDTAQIIKDRKLQLAELGAETNARVATQVTVRCGHFEDVVASYADDCAADIIVVGTPNRSWIESLLNTSMARTVTRLATCPVLVVPEQA